MIRSLFIEGYRGFDRFELHELGRVNLIVGTNNCGKTSVLEAVNILAANGDFASVWATLSRRGEDFYDERERAAGGISRNVDVRRLFHGHDLRLGRQFTIRGTTQKKQKTLLARVIEHRPERSSTATQTSTTPPLFDPYDDDFHDDLTRQPSTLELTWSGDSDVTTFLDISRRGGISADTLRRTTRTGEAADQNIWFITASALSSDVVINLFDDVVLTPHEELTYDILRIIEPSIERLAPQSGDRSRNPRLAGVRGGMYVKCQGQPDRIPIGSMGDGIWRLLGLALAMVRAEGGVLLVDEIDTGLHYGVMEDMWKLVYRTAKRLKIQVFATTHSRDCYESLAGIAREARSEKSEVTIQRIEKGKKRAVMYSEQEIVAAAERGMEVR